MMTIYKFKSSFSRLLTLAVIGICLLRIGSVLAEDSSGWDKTFPKSPKVSVEKVNFKNRLGINLVADLYVPKSLDKSKKNAAIIVGHPFGGVKEQTSGLYAQQVAERGFVTLAFDASYNGESGGKPHFISSPDVFVEDFSAATDYLGTLSFVDRERIGVLGVCASGGFAIAAAQIDPRIKAVATVSMYDMGGAKRDGLNKTMSDKDRKALLEEIASERWAEVDGGETHYTALPEKIDSSTDAVTREFFEYYRTPRGRHPRSTTGVSLTSSASYFHFRPFEHINTISPRPLLIIAGEKAHSRYFSEDAFNLAAEPKTLLIVPEAGHVDLYDNVQLIPFDKLSSFFKTSLGKLAKSEENQNGRIE